MGPGSVATIAKIWRVTLMGAIPVGVDGLPVDLARGRPDLFE